jgi:tetratricopeptide (TPR) repeat protein
MSGYSWNRIEALFAAALDRPTDERAAYVQAASPDPETAEEVLSLLHASNSRGYLDSLTDQLRHHCVPATSYSRALEMRLASAFAGRYRIERELGRGGMAVVFLVEELKHHRKLALKVLQPGIAFSVGAPRFFQEITFAAQLAHPHILPLHDSGEVDDLLFYVMPYVDGESLRDRLLREGRLPLIDSLTIAREVADAVSYAHGRGVVHRDIKPENILLLAGHAVVADFGIAAAMTAAGGSDLRETGVILGTPAYMSPEQAAGEQVVDVRVDVYALGCVLFEMLTGQPPFSGGSADAILARKLASPAPSVRSIQPMVPESVERTLQRALALAPADRFETARQFAASLTARVEEERAGESVTPSEHVRQRRARVASPQAYGQYLRGNFHLERGSEDAFRQAIECYQQAIGLDPTFAPAHAAMATAYIELGSWMASLPPSAVRAQATAAALQAVEHDPELAEAHITLARIKHLFDWNWVEADEEFRTGIALNPTATFALIIYSNYLMSAARFEEAAAVAERAISRDPHSPAALEHLGWALEYLGRDAEALCHYRKVQAISRDYFNLSLAEFLVKHGEREEASQLVERFERVLGPDGSPTWLALISHLYGKLHRTHDAERIIAALEARAAKRYVPLVPLASAHLGLGRTERALELIERAYDVRDVTLVWLDVRWVLDPLRGDSRFEAMLRRMRFPRHEVVASVT